MISSKNNIKPEIKDIINKIDSGERISQSEAVFLYHNSDLGLLGTVANNIKEKQHGKNVYFNKNLHLELSNICINKCTFCAFANIEVNKQWEYSLDDISEILEGYSNAEFSEIHIVGGVNPNKGFDYYLDVIKLTRKAFANVHIKAYTAAEIDYMMTKANISIEEGLLKLKEAGLNSIPGGGAEIFDEDIRAKICPLKTTSDKWLQIHRVAHQIGLSSNCTILYGHIENIEHRIEHLSRLRDLQDKTAGFNAFIPLKFKNNEGNFLNIKETNNIDVMKMFALSRIFLDNIKHIKAYWPLFGIDIAQLALSFGADDIDGTMLNATKIYDMESSMNTDQIIEIVKQTGCTAVERDSNYNKI